MEVTLQLLQKRKVGHHGKPCIANLTGKNGGVPLQNLQWGSIANLAEKEGGAPLQTLHCIPCIANLAL